MRRVILPIIAAAVTVISAASASGATESDLTILTYPIGLVVGEQPIDVDLGASSEPAVLYLDGEKVCVLRTDSPHCTVDMGEAPHVHLLELIRRNGAGHVVAYASRWVNRPGQEAELAIQLVPRNPQGICGGRALWSHPTKRDPVLLEVTENGRQLLLGTDKRSFQFPCPDPEMPHVVAASAIFPDGSRAEAVTLSGGFGGHAESGLTAVPLVAANADRSACENLAAELGPSVKPAGDAGFEVVFVLDPTAGYRTLMATGWSRGMMPNITSTTKHFDTLVQSGSKGSESKAKNSWKRADASLIDADKMWFVIPDADLHRANGFAQGTMNWLPMLFHFGSRKIEGKPRFADAVAVSGLVAAAGPRRRAVVVILGNKADRDGSQFTAEEARAYLAEVGVPLYVLRNGKLKDDGWPKGLPIHNMEAMAAALEVLRRALNGQCVMWFPGTMHPDEISGALPEGVMVAGRQGEAPMDVETVWQSAAAGEEVPREAIGEPAPGGAVARGRLEVTAVNVLIQAQDENGVPVSDLTAGEVTVAEDGHLVQVLGLAPAQRARLQQAAPEPAAEESPLPSKTASGMPVAVFLNTDLAGSSEITATVNALAKKAEWLASLGPVDLVVADQGVTTVLRGEEDPAIISGALLDLARAPAGRNAIEQIRTRFLRDIRRPPQRLTPDNEATDPERGVIQRLQDGKDVPELERTKVVTAAKTSIIEEDALLRRTLDQISDWALESPTARPRLLLAVGCGFDEDPVAFYLPFVERTETHHTGTAQEEFKRYRQSTRVEQTALDLAAAGWLVVPVASRNTGKQSGSAELGGGDRFQTFLSAQPEAVRTHDSEWLLIDPLGAQRHLAEPSGGEVAVGAEGINQLVDASSGWYRLSYQVERPPDGSNHRLAVATSRPSTEVRAASVVASETLESAAAARVRRLLRGSGDSGDVGVEISVGLGKALGEGVMEADVVVSVDLESIATLFAEGERPLRISVGVLAGDTEPFILHRTEMVGSTTWRYEIPLRWPAGPAELAVAVEDLGSGAWGGATANLR